MSDLITNLRALAACKHDDLSVAADAADRIAELQAENARLAVRIDACRAEARRQALEEAERTLRRRAHDLASAGHKHEALPWIEVANAIRALMEGEG